MSVLSDNLQAKAAELATGPGYADYERFMQALALYVSDIKERCIQSPHDKIFTNQGRAQEGAFLFELLKDAAAVQRAKEAKTRK